VAFQIGGGGTINLPAVDANAGALAANATWGIGSATYDLNHNGNPISFPLDFRNKIGNFVAGSANFQKVEFDSLFGTCGDSTCPEYGHLYQWQNGNWVQQWITQPIPLLTKRIPSWEISMAMAGWKWRLSHGSTCRFTTC
jgi:hypothetical protein